MFLLTASLESPEYSDTTVWDGQHVPSGPAWLARQIKINFCVGVTFLTSLNAQSMA